MSACYPSTLKGQDTALLATVFRHRLIKLAEAASRVVDSVTDPEGGTDGFHRLALEIANGYKAIADERQIK